jgi:hypothetical protein
MQTPSPDAGLGHRPQACTTTCPKVSDRALKIRNAPATRHFVDLPQKITARKTPHNRFPQCTISHLVLAKQCFT